MSSTLFPHRHSKLGLFLKIHFGDYVIRDDVIGISDTGKESLTLIRESWKINPKRGTVTERVLRKKIQRAALHHFVYVPMFWNFFPESALGDGPKKWHIFLFSTAYFCTYWHMPFKIYITI